MSTPQRRKNGQTAPEFDEAPYADPADMSEVGSYYGPEGRGCNP